MLPATARAVASSTSLPRARATPIRRFLSVLGLANRRTSTGLSASPSASASRHAVKAEVVAFAVGQDDRRGRGPGQLDRGDRQAEDGAEVQLELVGGLADQRDHAGVVRAGRKLGEDRAVAGDEEFDPENALAAERVDDLGRLLPGRT